MTNDLKLSRLEPKSRTSRLASLIFINQARLRNAFNSRSIAASYEQEQQLTLAINVLSQRIGRLLAVYETGRQTGLYDEQIWTRRLQEEFFAH